MKDIFLVITLLVAVIMSIVVVRFAQRVDKANKNLEEERYSRMVAEETLQKNENKMSSFQIQIKEDQDKISKIADILNQEKGVNASLKKQYDDLTAAKSNLESKLDSVLQEKQQAVAALQAQEAQAAVTAAVPASVPKAAAPTAAGQKT